MAEDSFSEPSRQSNPFLTQSFHVVQPGNNLVPSRNPLGRQQSKSQLALVCWKHSLCGQATKYCELPGPLPYSFEFFAESIKRRCFEAHL